MSVVTAGLVRFPVTDATDTAALIPEPSSAADLQEVVHRIRYTQAPGITTQPADRQAAAGSEVVFRVAASGAGPLSYEWQRNGANIPGATAAEYSLTATAADHTARFRVIVRNPFGQVASREA